MREILRICCELGGRDFFDVNLGSEAKSSDGVASGALLSMRGNPMLMTTEDWAFPLVCGMW